MPALIAVVERCLRAKADGRLVAPPRHSVAFDAGQLVFTIGGIAAGAEGGGIAGFRVYEHSRERAPRALSWSPSGTAARATFSGWSSATPSACCGRERSAASPSTAWHGRMSRICGLVGAGRQAESQIMAAVAVRPGLQTIRVYSRNPRNREDFAERMSARLGKMIQPVAAARDAVAGADLVLCATDSGAPVIETQWLARGTHLSTLGPKLVDRHELPRDIGEARRSRCDQFAGAAQRLSAGAFPRGHAGRRRHARSVRHRDRPSAGSTQPDGCDALLLGRPGRHRSRGR